MDKAELSACLEQADSKEAGALLRAALRNKMREALMEIFEEERLCGSSHSRDSKSDYYRSESSPAKRLTQSAVSRFLATKAKALIDEMLGRDLSDLDILVVMLDGIYLCDGLCSMVAIGID